MAIKNNLKDIRHDLRMNQTEFADYLELNVHQYNRYESNKDKQPNLETALRLFEKINKRFPEKQFEEIFFRAHE